MIVVLGDVGGRADEDGGIVLAGFAATVATAAAAAGSKVELVTRFGEDEAGDALVLALARAGVGHVATLRDAGKSTLISDPTPDGTESDVDEDGGSSMVPPPEGPTLEAADVGLALRYLSDYRVIVVVHPMDGDVLSEAAAAAGWSSAHLVVVTSAGQDDLGSVAGVITISAEPDADAVAVRIGRYAAAVDAGGDLGIAYAALTGANADS